MADFSCISRMFVTATRHPVIMEFCSATGHKIVLHRAERGWLLRIGSERWSTPAFGSVSELVDYCRKFLEGMICTAIPLDSTRVHRDDYERAIAACVQQMEEPAKLYPVRLNGRTVYV